MLLPTRLGTYGRLGAAARRLSSGQPQAARDVEKRLRLPEYLLNVPPTQVRTSYASAGHLSLTR